MSDFQIRSLEFEVRKTGDEHALHSYINACLRAHETPSYDLAVIYVQNIYDKACIEYTRIHTPSRWNYPGAPDPDIEYLPIPYDLLLKWVELGRRLNVAIKLQRSQSYSPAGERFENQHQSTEIVNYFLSGAHYDDFGFQFTDTNIKAQTELILYSIESGFIRLSDHEKAESDGQWPYEPREEIFPDPLGRRTWPHGYSTCQFIMPEKERTYEEILSRALEVARDDS